MSGCPRARIRFEDAGDRLVNLIEETSLGPGGLNDYTLWMEIWVRARRDPSVRRSYFRLDRRQRVLIADIVRDGQQSGEFSDATPTPMTSRWRSAD